jgi:tetratricopeptide (TPR) repeat protein
MEYLHTDDAIRLAGTCQDLRRLVKEELFTDRQIKELAQKVLTNAPETRSFSTAPQRCKENPYFVECFVRSNWKVFSELPTALQNSTVIRTTALISARLQGPESFDELRQRIWPDESQCPAEILQLRESLPKSPVSLEKYWKSLGLGAFLHSQGGSQYWTINKDVILAAVREDYTALRAADQSLKKDREFVLAAVRQNGWALEFADESLKKDREVVLAAVRQNGWALEHADASLKKDREVVLAAVRQNGLALAYADESFKKDREIVLAAVRQNSKAIEFADESLKNDPEIVSAAGGH